MQVDKIAQVSESLFGRHVRDISEPNLIDGFSGEVLVKQIGGWSWLESVVEILNLVRRLAWIHAIRMHFATVFRQHSIPRFISSRCILGLP